MAKLTATIRVGLLPDSPLVDDEWSDALKAAMILVHRVTMRGEPFPPAELFPGELRALDTWDGVMGNLMAIANMLWEWRKLST